MRIIVVWSVFSYAAVLTSRVKKTSSGETVRENEDCKLIQNLIPWQYNQPLKMTSTKWNFLYDKYVLEHDDGITSKTNINEEQDPEPSNPTTAQKPYLLPSINVMNQLTHQREINATKSKDYPIKDLWKGSIGASSDIPMINVFNQMEYPIQNKNTVEHFSTLTTAKAMPNIQIINNYRNDPFNSSFGKIFKELLKAKENIESTEIRPNTCENDLDCPKDNMCSPDGVCIKIKSKKYVEWPSTASWAQCTRHSDCPPDRFCYNQWKCVSVDVQLIEDYISPEASDILHTTGRLTQPSYCHSNSNCKSDHICVHKICVNVFMVKDKIDKELVDGNAEHEKNLYIITELTEPTLTDTRNEGSHLIYNHCSVKNDCPTNFFCLKSKKCLNIKFLLGISKKYNQSNLSPLQFEVMEKETLKDRENFYEKEVFCNSHKGCPLNNVCLKQHVCMDLVRTSKHMQNISEIEQQHDIYVLPENPSINNMRLPDYENLISANCSNLEECIDHIVFVGERETFAHFTPENREDITDKKEDSIPFNMSPNNDILTSVPDIYAHFKCKEHGDCPSLSICIDAVCTIVSDLESLEIKTKCSSDKECDGNQQCQLGACTRLPEIFHQDDSPSPNHVKGTCIRDLNCPNNYICIFDLCEHISNIISEVLFESEQEYSNQNINICKENVDCPSNFDCVTGQCISKFDPKIYNSNAYQPMFQSKFSLQSEPVQECLTITVCLENKFCIQDKCINFQPSQTRVRSMPFNTDQYTCKFNEHCPEKQLCLNGFCWKIFQNRNPDGFVSKSNYLETIHRYLSESVTPFKCLKNSNCNRNQFCYHGLCLDSPEAKFPMQTFYMMLEYVMNPTYCNSDQDCQRSYKCFNSKCVLPLVLPSGYQNNPDGLPDKPMHHVMMCRKSTDCSDNLECQNGICVVNPFVNHKESNKINHQDVLDPSHSFKDRFYPSKFCSDNMHCSKDSICLHNTVCVRLQDIFDLPKVYSTYNHSPPNGENIRILILNDERHDTSNHEYDNVMNMTEKCLNDSICRNDKICYNDICNNKNINQCETNGDCASSQLCLNSSCQAFPLTTCKNDPECTDGMLCIDGICQNEFYAKKCKISSDCLDHEICLDNICHDNDKPCNESIDCMYNEVCIENVCKVSTSRSPADCVDSSDCQPSQYCFRSICFDYSKCNINIDCDEGYECRDGDCQMLNECYDDEDCNHGETCKNHACNQGKLQTATCFSIADCEIGEECFNNTCREGFSVSHEKECHTDLDCEKIQYCKHYKCINLHFDLRVCKSDLDCESNETCIDFTCKFNKSEATSFACNLHTDCKRNQLCLYNQCQDKPDDHECHEDQDCKSNPNCCAQAANDYSSSLCTPPLNFDGFQCVLEKSEDLVCNHSEDCPSTQVCTPLGRCLYFCVADMNCMENELCYNNYCISAKNFMEFFSEKNESSKQDTTTGSHSDYKNPRITASTHTKNSSTSKDAKLSQSYKSSSTNHPNADTSLSSITVTEKSSIGVENSPASGHSVYTNARPKESDIEYVGTSGFSSEIPYDNFYEMETKIAKSSSSPIITTKGTEITINITKPVNNLKATTITNIKPPMKAPSNISHSDDPIVYSIQNINNKEKITDILKPFNSTSKLASTITSELSIPPDSVSTTFPKTTVVTGTNTNWVIMKTNLPDPKSTSVAAHTTTVNTFGHKISAGINTTMPTATSKSTPEKVNVYRDPVFTSFVISGGRNQYMTNEKSLESVSLSNTCTPKQIPRLLIAIYDHMMFYVKDTLLVCGGHVRPNLLSDTCYIYTKGTDGWREGAKMPHYLKNAAKVTIGEKVYLLGGWIEGPTDQVLVYDAATESWSADRPLNSPMYGACAVHYNGGIIVTGGQHNAVGSDGSATKLVERLDLATGTWHHLPEMKVKRYTHGCAVHNLNGKQVLIVAGGTGEKSATADSSVEYLDLNTMTEWMPLKSPVKPRCCWPQLASIQGKLVLMSGEKSPSDSIEVFDDQDQSWKEAGFKMKARRIQSSAAAVPEGFISC